MALDDDQWIHLDAEDLAEEGIGKAYRRLLPQLSQYVAHPSEVLEMVDRDRPSYVVRCDGQDYVIWSNETPADAGSDWFRATFALFSIVNKQLEQSPIRFYAINQDNELGGMFLTPEKAFAAQQNSRNKSDWPYIPNMVGPWFGRYR